ncbi:MAG TPA: MaoC family dehydratase N-terminal domain-containing protein [Actinomycetota bacterium]|nr:MaoC family dehydratase N-terminal domain-containing protein [Actinomycetota bacterium]
MPLNVALEGKAYPTLRFEVREEHVRRFARAVGEGEDSVPPTFVTAPEFAAGLTQVIGDADLGLDLSRVLHGEQEYEWRRPVRPGDVLDVTSTIESIRAKGGREFLTLRTEMRDAEDDLVVVARSSLLVQGGGA